MKMIFWSVGGKHEKYVQEGISQFTSRVNHYYSCEWNLISPPKHAASMTEQVLRNAESDLIMANIEKTDFLILLDERGKMLDSPGLAKQIEDRAMLATKKVHFVIGGAYGVNDALRSRANFTWQLSKLVFPHQLVRLMLAEQVYRACTILRGEKYHHI